MGFGSLTKERDMFDMDSVILSVQVHMKTDMAVLFQFFPLLWIRYVPVRFLKFCIGLVYTFIIFLT